MYLTDFIPYVGNLCGGVLLTKSADTLLTLGQTQQDAELRFTADPLSTYVLSAYLGSSKFQAGTTVTGYRVVFPAGSTVISNYQAMHNSNTARGGAFVTSGAAANGMSDSRFDGLQSPDNYGLGVGTTATSVHVSMKFMLLRTGVTGGLVVVEWAHTGTGGTVVGAKDSHMFYKKI